MLVYNHVIECFVSKMVEIVVGWTVMPISIKKGDIMTTDLLFSILPREGKVPIAHDSQKVEKIDRQAKLRTLSDEEKELKNEEKEARKKRQNKNDSMENQEPEPNPEQVNKDDVETEQNNPKGPKHLDIYV
ncbi:MAG: hypothetical protein ACI89T_002480 [Cognaticolwellia sp.]|jgi:hypothetical protein